MTQRQTQTSLKSTGGFFTAEECNELINSINENAQDAGNRTDMDIESALPNGYLSLVSVKNSDIVISAYHTAGGLCYSVDGGSSVYTEGADLIIPHNNGAPVNIVIWPATSVSSGLVGNLTTLNCDNQAITHIDCSKVDLLEVICDQNLFTQLDFFNNPSMLTMHINNCAQLKTVRLPDGISAGHHGGAVLFISNCPKLEELIVGNFNLSLWVEISGNPCIQEGSLVDGEIYTAAELTSLATSKGISLIIDETFEVPAPYSQHLVQLKNCNFSTDAIYRIIDLL